MIKTTDMMLEELKNYASPKTKLSRMVQKGECFQIVKGLYETSRNVSPYLLAGSIYGPSYISFAYALSYYGLIPEQVYTITSACFDKKKKKKYETLFGIFTYRDVPREVFPLEIKLENEGEYWYRIATPEKALCDQLYSVSPVKNNQELYELLTDNLRIEEEELRKLNRAKIEGLSEKYHSSNVKKLCSLLGRI